MHDIKAIRDDRDGFVERLAHRPAYRDTAGAAADAILAKDRELRDLLVRLQGHQARRNEASKLIGQAKAKKDEAQAASLMEEVAGLKQSIQDGEAEQRKLETELRDLLAVIPNLPAADAPDGDDETANVPVPQRAFGTPPRIDAAKQHFEIGEALGQMDFERAAKVSGARFVYLKGDLARLERAIAALMLDTHTGEFGFTEVSPPVLVRDAAMFGTGQLPKFEDDLFEIFGELRKLELRVQERRALDREKNANMERLQAISKSFSDAMYAALSAGCDARWSAPSFDLLAKTFAQYKDEFFTNRDEFHSLAEKARELGKSNVGKTFLIPTAEVSLTNYVADEILAEAELPIRFTAHTPCFRAEAGSAGRDTRGMIRMHQFSKVELVSITAPEKSGEEHERMTDAAQAILKKLDLAHRVVTLCTGDMGFSARKTYDIEVWLPGQGAFREISSCSNCGDFQARRMNTRLRNAEGKVKGPVHTLNGSGLAVGRTLVAILENYQRADGSVAVPDALVPYMGGKTRIEKAD